MVLHFTTATFRTILSEARKHRFNLVIANQFLSQIPDDIRDAVFGNVSTIIAFRISYLDSEILAPEMGMQNPQTLASSENHTAWVRKQLPASAVPTSLFGPPDTLGRFNAVQKHTRANHAISRAIIDQSIEDTVARSTAYAK